MDVKKSFLGHIFEKLNTKKHAYKEFVRKSIVFDRVEQKTSGGLFVFYFVFAKYPDKNFIADEYLDQLQHEIEKANKEKNPRFDQKEQLLECLKYYNLIYNAKKLPGQPLGYIWVDIATLKSFGDISHKEAHKDGVSGEDTIAQIIRYYPLVFVGKRFHSRGVGGKAILFALDDLKSSYNVKWVYLFPLSEAQKILLKNYSFKVMKSTGDIYRKL